MGLFSMKLVGGTPGLTRVYKNALGFTKMIERRETKLFFGTTKSYLDVHKFIKIGGCERHGRHVPVNLQRPIFDKTVYVWKRLLRKLRII